MQRIVVKLGTSVLTKGTARLNRQRMLEIAQQIAGLHEQGYEMIIVSSGAQTAGREQLAFPDLGKSVPAKQMLSAVGQSHLMRVYQDLFDIFEIAIAQILLTPRRPKPPHPLSECPRYPDHADRTSNHPDCERK